MTLVRLKPAAPGPRVKHSTTEPLRLLRVPWDGLQCVIVVLPRNTHLLFRRAGYEQNQHPLSAGWGEGVQANPT